MWDTFAGSIVEVFDTLALALTWIRGQIEQDEVGGEDPATGVMHWWALIEVHEKSWGTIAEGRELLALARKLT